MTRGLAGCLVLLLSFATVAQDEPAPAPKATKTAPNAAVLYRKAIEELQKALPAPEYEGDIDLPEDPYGEAPDLNSLAWQEAVRKSAVAITLFAQASQIPNCKFDAKVEDLETEFVSKATLLMYLRRVVAAHGWQQAKKDPRGAGATAMQLLQLAKHCAQERFMIAIAVGFTAEEDAAKILRSVAKQLASQEDGPAVAKRLLKQLDQHLAKRPTRLTLAEVVEQEFSWVLEHGLADIPNNQRTKAASRRAAQITRDIVAPLRKNPTITVEALRAHTKKHHDRLRKLTKAKTLETVLKNGAEETLAAVMALMASTDPSRLLEPFLKTSSVLQECRQQLLELAGK